MLSSSCCHRRMPSVTSDGLGTILDPRSGRDMSNAVRGAAAAAAGGSAVTQADIYHVSRLPTWEEAGREKLPRQQSVNSRRNTVLAVGWGLEAGSGKRLVCADR